VRLLLDTHILLWALADSPRLSARARELLGDPQNECWVSSASVWEIAIKVRLGKHELDWSLGAIEQVIGEAGFRAMPVSMRHAAAVETVDSPHGDPFDRLLLAQCETETLRLLTSDRLLRALPVAVAC
jgi:PIN domain nuclease of toxin-antitoxin system